MNKRFLFTTLLTAFIVVTFFSVEEVSAQNLYEVGVDSLNIREEPAEQSDVITYVQRGVKLEVNEIKFGWAKVNINGKVGWVASHYLIAPPTQATQNINQSTQATSNANKLTIAGEIVNIRSGPGTNHPIVAKASRGDQFTYIQTNNDWAQIQLSDGSTAWVANWLVSVGSITQTQSHVPGNLSGRTIILDAGHGGFDSGSIALNGIFEKKYTLNTTLNVKNQLEAAGAEVILTRTNDQYVELAERARISNAFPGSIFISLHYNGALDYQARGINTFYYHNQDRALANAVQKQLIAETGLKDRGEQFGNYYVLRNNHSKALLIELGFITNDNDLYIINTQEFQNNVAKAIVQGITNYYN